MAAIEELTKRHTGEHAIRPYIVSRPERTCRIMLGWAESANVHVKRLASEGLRPRLPWSKKLTIFIEDPEPVFRVLERLIRHALRNETKQRADDALAIVSHLG